MHSSTGIATNRNVIPLAPVLILLLIPVLILSASIATAAQSSSSLTREFRAASKDPAARQKIVKQAIAAGRPTTEALALLIEREMRPQLKRYRDLFTAQARRTKGTQVTKAVIDEVTGLRQKVLALQNAGDGFTKEQIVAVADPAMARLHEIFFVDRSAVLAGSEKLQAERDRIAATGKLWEECLMSLWMTAANNKERTKDQPNFEQYLQGEEELAIGMAAPMPNQTRNVMLGNARLAAKIDPEEGRAVNALNLTRMLLGLSPVAIDLRLAHAARDHSADMKRLVFFDHTSPIAGKVSPWDRAKLAGTKANAENIYRGVTDGRAANLAWFHSPPHHKNMLGPFTRVGIGRAGVYYTEMFGK